MSLPQTPPPTSPAHQVHTVAHEDGEAGVDIVHEIPNVHRIQPKFRRREADFDPLIFAAAISSGPQVTRHHFHHGFLFPSLDDDKWEPTKHTASEWSDDLAPRHPYVSRQKPRTQRLREEQEKKEALERLQSKPKVHVDPHHDPEALHDAIKAAAFATRTTPDSPLIISPRPTKPIGNIPSVISTATVPKSRSEPLQIVCRARTRIPTPHGPVFLHLYHNNWDTKEHLAIVVDPAQLDDPSLDAPQSIRSRSLDSIWFEGETEMDRLVRGAYVGRLSDTQAIPSQPSPPNASTSVPQDFIIPPPLVRIHSECFTGETIGSMRCDCGEQLDEAIRLISQPQTVYSASSPNVKKTIPGRGAIIYLRQEGRGIGLLEKIRAYNLQDMGHDTVSANLLLGHGADERAYDIAAAMLKDLGLGAGEEHERQRGVRILTNNPEKMEAMEREGIRITQRVPMVPRSWKCGDDSLPSQKPQHRPRGATITNHQASRNGPVESDSDEDQSSNSQNQGTRLPGATLIGGGAAYGPELERYLRTKVERMRHMIDLPSNEAPSSASSSAPELISQAPSDDETFDDDEEFDGHMAHSLASLVSSLASRTPELMSDDESMISGGPRTSPKFLSRVGSPQLH